MDLFTKYRHFITINNLKDVNFSDIEWFFKEKAELTIIDTLFAWNEELNAYFPIKGGYNTLGSSVIIKSYSIPEILELAGNVIKFEVVLLPFWFANNKPDITDTDLVLKTNGSYEIIKYTDYSNIITYLEQKGKLSVKPSCSYMTTDGRVFFLDGEWFEVDILGTTIRRDISEKIYSLCLTTMSYKDFIGKY